MKVCRQRVEDKQSLPKFLISERTKRQVVEERRRSVNEKTRVLNIINKNTSFDSVDDKNKEIL
jgi:hypothetical protein